MRNERISQQQFAQMVYPTMVTTAILFGPPVMASYAGNDLWLSPIWGGIVGLLTLSVMLSLSRYYPRQTFAQYIQQIIGRIPGKILGLVYLLLQVQLNGWIVRDYTDFISMFLVQTPSVVISSTLIFVCAMAVYAGLEALARSAQFFFLLCVIPLVITIILVIKDLQPGNLMPVLAKGVLPSIQGAVYPAAWFSEIFFLFTFFPFLKNKKSTGSVVRKTLVAGIVTMIVVNVVTLMIVGNNIANLLYPMIDTAKYISIADFLENLESGIMAVWVMGVFVKFSALYYVLALSTASVFGLHSLRTVVAPLGLLILVFSQWGFPNFAAISEMRVAICFTLLVFTLFIPFCLLMIARFLRQNRRNGVSAP